MRTIILFISMLVSTFTYSQHTFDGVCKDLSHIIDLEKKGHEKEMEFRANVLTQNYDLKYHRMYWEVDPAVNYIKGEITTYFMPTEMDFQEINFDFAVNMTINEISYHGQPLTYSQANDNLQIGLPETIPLGQLDSVLVKYEGAPNSTGFGSFEQGTHNGTPVLWTLSEPYGAKLWWPCKQDLNDKIDSIDIIVRTPAEYRVGSNGILANEYVDGSDKIYNWKHRYSIPAYLIAIAVTNYDVFSDFVELDNGDSIEILNYVFPENLNSAIQQLQSTVEIMELFNELFGIYPFADEKYGHAEFGWGGGMEHQTMSFMGSFSYGLQAHELAHQWFGDKITCGSWQDIWLNEGFATYLTGLTSEFLGTEQAWMNWKFSRIANITSQPNGSVWVEDTTRVSRIFSGRLSYNKGSYLLHMLRWKLGDEDFFQAIQNYLADPELAFGYARTADLKAHFEAQSGIDLSEFFEDWFYGQGFPSYQISWSDLGEKVRIKIEQTTSDPSVNFFEMPVSIKVTGEGQDSLLRLEHTFSGQEFEVDLPFSVSQLDFDPSLWLLSADNTIEEVIISGTSTNQIPKNITVSPNPFTNDLHFSVHIDRETRARLDLFSSTGQSIENFFSGSLKKGEHRFHLNPAKSVEIPAGVYYLVLRTNEGFISKSIVKANVNK